MLFEDEFMSQSYHHCGVKSWLCNSLSQNLAVIVYVRLILIVLIFYDIPSQL
jgi:hypothetical protein